jgi:hypothetical protein
MTKMKRFLPVPAILLLLICARATRAQEVEAETSLPPPATYRMELVWVMDGRNDRHEFMFVLGSVGFKTVDGLKRFIAQLPAGSRLEWSPGCLRMGDEPLLSSAEEMEEFKRFCAEHGVEFILHPSG